MLSQIYRSSNDETREQPTSPTIRRINALLENYPLSTLLPYETFEPETGLYFNKASTGFVLGAEPLTGANEETIRILSSIITESLPEHATLQFLLFASSEIDEQLLCWKNQRKQAVPLYKILAGKRIEHLNSGKFSSLTQSSAFLVRNFKVVISSTLPGHLKGIELDRFINFREGLTTSLKCIPLIIPPNLQLILSINSMVIVTINHWVNECQQNLMRV